MRRHPQEPRTRLPPPGRSQVRDLGCGEEVRGELAILRAIFSLPALPPAPVRPAPEWRHTVEPGNDPDPQVDPSYQRSTQRACQRNYPKTEKRRR